jgi:branched-chain amino acid transport system ATP-binding protein
VVGGLTSLPGAVASGVLFAALAEVFYRVSALGALLEIVSSLLLAVVLIAYRGGLASIPERAAGVVERLSRRLEPFFERVAEGVPMRFRRSARGAGPTPEDGEPQERSRPMEVVRHRAAQMRLWVRDRREVLPVARLRPRPDLEPAPPLNFRAALERAASIPTNGHAPVDPAGEPVDHREVELARARVSLARPAGPRKERHPLVAAEGITVQFGGLTAVDNASLTVREGEIVGLIGPNGAGKTTLFNAIAGYNEPTAGTIRLYGQDVTHLPVHRRARVGVARTFQLIQLFRELTVYENLLVATHVHNPTGFGAHLVVSGSALRHEGDAIERVNEILELLDLTDLADRTTGDLPFGVLRMIEVARALVTGFRVVMLDEPASGLDNTETDRLIEVLRFVRGLGVTLLLIEHDVRMVTGVSDYMYVLEQGRMIAEGPPEDVQRNPLVIAAYLGEPAGEPEKEPVA